MNKILQKAILGAENPTNNDFRLTPAEGLELLTETPWTQVVEAANTVRQKRLPGNRVG